ncbi:glutaredoxin family protein [Acidipila sp. EB88]|uniref:glutaredoxin family protein n=1 Tax=Acidipila sp. EB88 TaxID=2305226 RepID=UPI000F5FD27A|nr:glutaredoxin family protein [Acidipila sp. EB88]RRA48941.1 glutaredoxin family protein [Acidipila sp. EB88]
MNDTVPTAAQTAPHVVLYSQPGCAPCFAARSFLTRRKVAFEYKDVQADPQAFRELMDLGSRSTPTLTVDGEVMIGFDAEKLGAMLEAAVAGATGETR